MNREIKFRGKAIDDGEWLIGDLIHRESNNKSISNMQIKPFDYGGAYAVDKSTVGQFTGLTDKNGKEIFEGDIALEEGYSQDTKWHIRYDVSLSEYRVTSVDDECDDVSLNVLVTEQIEVIGNIHDNHELLKNE